MAKGYWIVSYRSVTNPSGVAEYGKLAVPAIEAGGGRIVVRGAPSKVYEAGLDQRSVVIEFDSVQSAIATYESPSYQAALKILKGAAERDLRIVEGVS
jgi:uncharacterized protein (DUF1330 family)